MMQLVFAIMSKLDENDAAINMLQFRFNRNKSKFKYIDNKSLRFWYPPVQVCSTGGIQQRRYEQNILIKYKNNTKTIYISN